MKELIPQVVVEQRIYLIRGKRVMLDEDLAELYEVPKWRLKERRQKISSICLYRTGRSDAIKCPK